MQLLKCKREETAKDWNKEAFCCVLEGVFPFSSSDQSLLLCFLARLMCFGGCFLSPAQIKVCFFACLLD
jgi:hypothetical protein